MPYLRPYAAYSRDYLGSSDEGCFGYHTDWFCEKCNHELKHYRFDLDNIEKDFLPRFKEFYTSEAMRTCTECGHVMEADERFI